MKVGRFVAVAMALGVATLGLAAPASSSQPRPAAWHARIVIPGNFSGVVAADGTLYAVRSAPHGPSALTTRVVRVDPFTERVVAQSQILPGATLPVFADRHLWVSGVTWYSPRATGEGPMEITELNPSTLTRVRQVVFRPGTSIGLFGGPSGLLLATDLYGNQKSCVLRWINPTTGRAYRSVIVARNLGPCVGDAVDSSGQFVYVAVNGPSYDMELFKLDAQTGALVARVRAPAVAQGCCSIAATPGRVWLGASDMGAPGYLLYFDASPFRLLAETCVDVCASKGRMPIFGDNPTPELTGGRIWVTSTGVLACFRPSSGRALATAVQYHPPIVGNAIVDVADRIWGIGSDSGAPPAGLVRLFPPRVCG